VSAKTADVLTHPRSSIFDYKALSQYDDYVFVMAWGAKWATSPAGPQDDLPWVQDVAAYVATMPLKDKFVLGTMLYGMDWPAGGGPDNPGVGRHFPEIQALAARPGATNVFDPGVGSMHLHYTDDAGVPHDVWYSDAPAVGLRTALARRHGLKIGFWRAGQEDPRVWNDPNIAPGS
jgi:spore germination protein YaaH